MDFYNWRTLHKLIHAASWIFSILPRQTCVKPDCKGPTAKTSPFSKDDLSLVVELYCITQPPDLVKAESYFLEPKLQTRNVLYGSIAIPLELVSCFTGFTGATPMANAIDQAMWAASITAA